MNKYEAWYNNQNDTTKAWLDAQQKEDDKLIFLGMGIGFILGIVVGIILI